MDKKEIKIIEAAQQLFFRHGIKKVSMSDIAEASELSRPSVYSVFANKEAVIAGLLENHISISKAETEKRLASEKKLQDQLDCLFDIWIVEPFASAMDTPGGKEMMKEVSQYAPGVFDQVYDEFEILAAAVLKSHMKKKSHLTAKELAHILALATKGLKTSSENLAALKRLVKGLVIMTINFVEN